MIVTRSDTLIALVREWQEARKPAQLEAPGVNIAETYRAAVMRMAAADEALAAYDLDGPAGGALAGQTAPAKSTGASPLDGIIWLGWASGVKSLYGGVGRIQHGVTCEKQPHDKPGGGYLHGDDDDRPYDVDGWAYCGRCHRVLEAPCSPS